MRTTSLDKSLHFWVESVGLALTARHGSFAFVDGGSVQITINEIEGEVSDDSFTELVFEVEDIEKSYQNLGERGVAFEVEPRVVTSDGSRDLYAAHFHDPDGHLASITAWRSRPPGPEVGG